MFSAFSVNHSNGLGYNSFIEANSTKIIRKGLCVTGSYYGKVHDKDRAIGVTKATCQGGVQCSD